MELAEAKSEDQRESRLNSMVAVSIAILAAFMGICAIKDGNVVQSMQMAQAKSIDTWNYYQAKNIRQDVYQSTADQLRLQGTLIPTIHVQSAFSREAKRYQALANKEQAKKADLKAQAEKFDKDYDQYNFHDDQFDLSEAAISLSISLLAVTALTKKSWLFSIALVPAAFGIFLGLCGLLGWNFHPEALIKPLT